VRMLYGERHAERRKSKQPLFFAIRCMHHEKAEIFGAMYSGRIQSVPEFSLYSSIMSRILNARDISIVYGMTRRRYQRTSLYDFVILKIMARRTLIAVE